MGNIRQEESDIQMDEMISGLEDNVTKEIARASIIEIKSRKELKKFRQDNGWNINWESIPKSIIVYALALQETKEVQGLIGIKNDVLSHAVFIHWMASAPQNNKYTYGVQKYRGVGRNLVAIAIRKSVQWGYEGVVHGYAANIKLLKYYMAAFGAEYLGMLHQYHFLIDEVQAKRLMEENDYERDET